MSGLICYRCNEQKVFLVDVSISSGICVDVYKCLNCGNVRIWCPLCNQGWVDPWHIIRLDEVVFSCDECDAAWQNIRDIGGEYSAAEQPGAFCLYLEKHGMIGAPEEVTLLGMNDKFEVVSE